MGLLGYERRVERAVGVPGAALGRLEGGFGIARSQKGQSGCLFPPPAPTAL